MEIVRYLNGSEISREELYLKKYVSDEMKAAMKDGLQSFVQSTQLMQ